MFEKHITRPETILISIDPVFIYIRNIITPEDISYFLHKCEGQFERSKLFSPGKMDYTDESIRDSFYFDAPEVDIRADSLFTKLRTFEEKSKDTLVEASRIQRYYEDGHFSYHFDALSDSDAVESFGNRVSTFMIYLEANVTGGGTHFPLLDARSNFEDRCEIIDCSGDRNGTTFRPIPGNALFWLNVRGDGRRHPATIHAGLPVKSEVKDYMEYMAVAKLVEDSCLAQLESTLTLGANLHHFAYINVPNMID